MLSHILRKEAVWVLQFVKRSKQNGDAGKYVSIFCNFYDIVTVWILNLRHFHIVLWSFKLNYRLKFSFRLIFLISLKFRWLQFESNKNFSMFVFRFFLFPRMENFYYPCIKSSLVESKETIPWLSVLYDTLILNAHHMKINFHIG